LPALISGAAKSVLKDIYVKQIPHHHEMRNDHYGPWYVRGLVACKCEYEEKRANTCPALNV